MVSIQSKLCANLFRIARVNKRWKMTSDKLKQFIKKRQLSETHVPPKKILNNYDICRKQINNYFYYEMKPLNGANYKHIFFIHGGAYVFQIMKFHWLFLGKMLDEISCSITVPIYPLAPKHKWEEVFDMLLPLYKEVISHTDPKNVVIMGDSVGGGMALSLAQLLKEKGIEQPGNIILISPTLDLTFDNHEIKKVEKYDYTSKIPALKEVATWYGGEDITKNYLVSPILGKFNELGRISLFIGTYDICFPDAKRLYKITRNQGVEINYLEYPKMIHDWPLFFFPESKKARNEIVQIISKRHIV